MRKRGDIEKLELEKLNTTVGLTHLGVDRAMEWQLMMDDARNLDRPRVIKLRKEFTREDWPEIYADDYLTTEGQRELTAHLRAILTETVAFCIINDIRVEGEEAVAELFRMGAHGAALTEAIRIQTPNQEHIFTEGSGDVASE